MYSQKVYHVKSLSSNKIDSTRVGLAFLYLAALIILGVGFAALFTAVTITILPHEEAFLQESVAHIGQHHHDNSLHNFIIHNRVAFSGTLISIGILYLYLIHFHLRTSQRWAWRTLLFSGIVGGSSYFSFIFSGYIDVWHGTGTAVILLCMLLGLGLTFPRASSSMKAPFWQLPFRTSRIVFLIWSLATFLGGIGILFIGISSVFVPQDLAFMQTTPAQIAQLNEFLVSFMAHDRTGFAGALVAIGIALLLMLWHVESLCERRFLMVITLVWLLDMMTAVGIHLVVGYISFSHLLPFLLKDVLFWAGIVTLIWENDHSQEPIICQKALIKDNKSSFIVQKQLQENG